MPLDIHPEQVRRKPAANDEPKVKPLVLAWWIWASVIVALILWGFAQSARAAPNVANAQECGLVADMVLVAAALQKRDVAPEKRAGVMEDAYRDALGGGEAKKWREIMELAVRFVRRDPAPSIEPQDLGDAVNQACQMGRGKLEPIFGAES